MAQQTTYSIAQQSGNKQSATAIEAEDVHVTYADGTEAVTGVDLTVQEGEFFGFLGPNGAGKTTTIKALVTLLHPTAGRIRVNGHDTQEDPQAVWESVGYMAQETSVDEELTARENLQFVCELYGVAPSAREERIENLLELGGLTAVADKRAETYSGGMKKRLDAATVLIHRPPVLFLDEPTTGLDPQARIEFWAYLRSLNDRGTTIFLTTQYLEEVDRLCDRLAIIRDGEVHTTDTPDALKAAVGGDILELTIPDDEQIDRAETAIREVETLRGPTIERQSDGLTVTAENIRDSVNDLFLTFHERGLTITGFDVRSPTLDDVFLQLTGQRPDVVDSVSDTDGSGKTNQSVDTLEAGQ